MNLLDALREECIEVGAQLADKESVMRAVAHCAREWPALRGVEESEILAGLGEREELGSTGFGNGIAIPHCRLADVEEFVVGIITVPEGVDFDALDGKPVHLVVFIVGPSEGANDHIRLLSAISQTLHGKGVVEEIIAERTPEAVLESFLRHAPGQLDTRGHRGKHLIHVFVQEEDLFHDILQVFAGIETSSAVVLTSENLSAYLAKVPLFQGLWGHEPGGFSHLVAAVVDKGLTNETIRQIETLSGGLDEQPGVLVTVQEIYYAAGSLSAEGGGLS